MSSEPAPPADDVGRLSGDSDEERGAAKIADPENYNLRRRLQQLHDAKERVGKVGERATLVEMTDRDFTPEQRAELVAEAVADYINELRPLLALRELDEEFLEQGIAPIEGETVTIGDLAEARGRLPHRDREASNPLLRTTGDSITGAETPPYEVSMMARSVCDDYFLKIAGVEFIGETPAPDANPVDPAGRFNE